ncbi:hypothetical protein [Haloplanus sp. C73]|uniref:hypothetical protein n=1 Tax=Haloplanus sp. C73 TaxID=3421641 RepID=UPI003EBC87FC
MNVAVRGGDDDDLAAIAVGGGSVVDEDAPHDALVAIGDDAIRSLTTDSASAPVLPVTPDDGRHRVARDSLDGAIAALAAGDRRLDTHPVLGLSREGSAVARALRDVTFVTDAPASISEYAVATGGERLDSVRADGFVVATPLGSDGYAGTAGGSVLEAGTGVTVVPIAPFSTSAETYVVDPTPDAPLSVSVERDGAVALIADGVRYGAVDRGATLQVERVDAIDLVLPTRTENF